MTMILVASCFIKEDIPLQGPKHKKFQKNAYFDSTVQNAFVVCNLMCLKKKKRERETPPQKKNNNQKKLLTI